MTDADLRALFDAWLRDRAQVHKLAQLSGAVLRAYTEAVTQAAVRTTYPPQIRAQSPAEAPPAAEEGSGGTLEPAIPTGGNLDDTRRGYSGITHAEGSPLLHSQDDFGRRHAARLVPRTVLLDGRGDAAPRKPEDDGA